MNPSRPPFRVTILPACQKRIQTLADRAVTIGRGEEFTEHLHSMLEHLARRPRDWGDPFWPLPGMQGVVYQHYWLGLGLGVEYLVHDTQSEVIVRSFEPLPRGPLA